MIFETLCLNVEYLQIGRHPITENVTKNSTDTFYYILKEVKRFSDHWRMLAAFT